MDNPVDWFEIYVQDMDRATRFYESLLSTRLSKVDDAQVDMSIFPMEPEGSGSAGALVKMPGFDSGGNSVLTYFAVDDCGVQADKAVELGGKVQKPKFSIGEHGYIALVVDSEGNMIGLHSRH